jgi:predicted transcriptional regulator
MVRKLVDTAFGGSAEGLVIALLDGRGVSRDEAERIRAMIDRAERRTP